MVSNVGGNNLGVLLQQKQKKLESINKQKDAVQAVLDKTNVQASDAKVKVGNTETSLSEAIVTLQNHPFKGMKMPEDVNKAKYEITNEDGTKGFNQKEYDAAMADFQKQADEYKKAEQEYKNLETSIEKTTKELDMDKKALEDLIKVADQKEQELKAADKDYDVTYGEVEDLNKQIEEQRNTETVDVKLSNDKNNDTLVEATLNQLKAMQDKGLIGNNVDLNNLSKDQMKKLCEAVVGTDIQKGAVAENTKLDGSSSDYAKMKAGQGRTYTVAEMQKIAESLGITSDSNDDGNFTISAEDLSVMQTEIEQAPILDKKPENANIKFPRGIEWQGEAKGDKLSDFGLTDNGDGTFTSSTGKKFTENEVNEWFREIEDSAGNNYSKYLDKAEKLGIDPTGLSSKELKEAVKTEEKRQKAIDKYSDKIKKYNINTDGKTADEIKNAVKTAEKDAENADKSSSKIVTVQKGDSAPKMNSTPVVYSEAAADASTTVTVQKGESAQKMSSTPVYANTNNLTNAQLDKKVKDLKAGETYTYTESTSVSGTGFSSKSSQTITWKRNDDGTLTKTYLDGAYQPSVVNDNYSADGQKVSTVSTNKYDPYKNVTTNYDANGAVKDRTIDLSSLPTSKSTTSMSKQQQLMTYLKRGQNSYTSQNITNKKGETILTYKQGKYFKPDGKEVAVDKAYTMIQKEIEKGRISNIRQLRS